jgi:hypothetical protein
MLWHMLLEGRDIAGRLHYLRFTENGTYFDIRHGLIKRSANVVNSEMWMKQSFNLKVLF